jgi:hypothetical protein
LDPLIGSQSYYKLSESLVSTLHSKGIFNLDQVASFDTGSVHGFNWKTAEFLDLIGEQKLEWENYVRGLKHYGFVLSDVRDSIVWSWDSKEGKVSAKQAYEVQFLEEMDVGLEDWLIDIWKWQIPLRIKLFCWLMIDNRILTWDNLLKRGFVGPSRCFLCGKGEETINHLMVYCSFTKEVWNYLLKVLKVQRIWECGQLSESFQNWNKVKENWTELPCYICWEIWRQRNLIIF